MGYPKGTKGYLFYGPSDNKTFVSMNARFLEKDYIKIMKPRSRLILEVLLGDWSLTPIAEAVPRLMVRVALVETEPLEPRRSRRVV